MTRSLEIAGSRRLADTPILTLVVGLALLSPASAQPMPKIGACPSGYHHSGGYCAPSSTAGQQLRRPARVSGRIRRERRVLPFEPVEPLVESPFRRPPARFPVLGWAPQLSSGSERRSRGSRRHDGRW